MTNPHWNRFEWDDENKKNGNVQHLRDHDIEPDEAVECFFHDFTFFRDERRIEAGDSGWFSRTKATASCESSRAGR